MPSDTSQKGVSESLAWYAGQCNAWVIAAGPSIPSRFPQTGMTTPTLLYRVSDILSALHLRIDWTISLVRITHQICIHQLLTREKSTDDSIAFKINNFSKDVPTKVNNTETVDKSTALPTTFYNSTKVRMYQQILFHYPKPTVDNLSHRLSLFDQQGMDESVIFSIKFHNFITMWINLFYTILNNLYFAVETSKRRWLVALCCYNG